MEAMPGTGQESRSVGLHARSARRGRVALVAAVALGVLAVALMSGVPAQALTQRGHTLTASFGSAFGAEEKDRLSSPSAVAVNEAPSGEGSGDSYVLDRNNNRVVRFGPAPAHQFLEAWGYGVEGGSGYQRCAAKCGPGLAGFAKDEFDSPVAIAVDNAGGSPSKGDVYVVANRTAKHAVIDKFSPTGEPLGTLIASRGEKEQVEGMIDGVAVDQHGTVWVEREDGEEEFALQRFSDAVANTPIGEPTELEIENVEGKHPARPGFAIGAEGDVYVTYEPGGEDAEEVEEEEEAIAEREKERKKAHEEPVDEQPQQPCTVHRCLVAKLAVADEAGELEAQVVAYELDGENTTGVAVDESEGAQASGDVYTAEGADVAAFAANGSLIQRFGTGQLDDGAGLAVDARTDEVLVADAAAGLIDAYGPAPAGAPVVRAGSVSAAQVSATSAELRAVIDPTGADTRYRFEYGPASCAVSACSEAPAAPGTDIGQGFGDQLAAEQVGGLSPDTTYHVRVIAENEFASGAGAVVSEERSFVTTAPVAAAALPDDRAWELVSPPEKHGGSVEPIAREGGLVQAASAGGAVTYMSTTAVGENEPEGNRAPERSQILATRGPAGWASRDIVTPNEIAEGIRGGLAREYVYFSSSLEEALVEPPSPQLLSPEATESTLYLRRNPVCPVAPQNCYAPLVTSADDTSGVRFGGQVKFAGATPDLRHVVVQSNVPLRAGEAHGGLYEFSGGQIEPVSVFSGGTQATGRLALGGGAVDEMHSAAISRDGSRVIWRVGGSEAGHLYMRELNQEATLQVDEPDSGAPAPKVESIPDFKSASADGSRVFFTDTQRLTANSTAPEEDSSATPRDLYVFEPDKPAGERVTDLTPDVNSGEGAGVHGTVMASEDGSLVYFVANGVLAEGAQAGDCHFRAPSSAGCNLYVAHYNGRQWEAPRWIARLSSEDNPDWGSPEASEVKESGAYNLKTMTSRVSPNGGYLAFMSSRPLTGYDNTDAASGAADEEVFLYRYGAGAHGSLVCASCNPTGAQPNGVYDTPEAGEGLGILIDRPEAWGSEVGGVDHWLAASVPGWTAVGLQASYYQSRYLGNSGRLFFNSADALVAGDGNRRADVYEYEPAGVGSCSTENTAGGCVALITSGESERESAFLDASESGGDVFFLTSAKLSKEDADTAADIYDARVCGVAGAEPCPAPAAQPPLPCDGEACKGPSSPQPSYGAPASSTFSGSGNLIPQSQVSASKAAKKAPTRAQKLAAALKSCRKLKQRKRRVVCEARARRSFAARKASARRTRRSRRGAIPARSASGGRR